MAFPRWTFVVATFKSYSSGLYVEASSDLRRITVFPNCKLKHLSHSVFLGFSKVQFGQLCLHVFSSAVIYFICSFCVFQFGICSYHSHMSTGYFEFSCLM